MLADRKIGLVVASLTLILTVMTVAPYLIPVTVISDGTSQSEIIVDSTIEPAPLGMVAYWELNENGGSNVYDTVGPYVNGHTVGGPTWVTGIAGSGLELLPNQFVDFGSPTGLYAIQTLTIEAWVNIPDTSGLHTILMNSYSSTYIMYNFAIKDGTLYFDRQSGPPGNYFTSSSSITADQWHHVAVVMDNGPGTVSFYINGTEQIIYDYNDYFSGPIGQVTIGADRSTGIPNYLHGMIDEVAVYNTVISQSTLEEHYEKGLLGLGYLDDFPTNVAPVAFDDSYTMDQDTTLMISASGVLENDTDIDGDTLETDLISDPTDGSLVLNPDGSFVYTPTSGFVGLDSFEYRAYDGVDYSTTATVTITVELVNHPPVAEDDAYTTDEDLQLSIASPGILANDHDAEPWNIITAEIVTEPQHGSLTLSLEGDFEYTPDSDWYGTDSFTYRVFDGTVYGNTATVTITVNPVNDAPVAGDDEYTGVEDIELVAATILLNDFDVDGDSFEIILVSAPSHGAMFLDVVTGIFSYQPDVDWSGIDTFTYQLYDGSMYSNIATVTLTISSVNDVPVSEDDEYTTDEDTSLTILISDLLANDYDVDGDTLTIQIESVPSFGIFDILLGEFIYTPNQDWYGTASFTYRVFDGSVFGNLATVTILVDPVNDAPVANDIAYYAGESSILSIEVHEGVLTRGVIDIDTSSALLTVHLVDGPAVGTLTLNPDGIFEYYVTGWSGTVTFTYRAFDGTDYSNTATVTIYDIGDDDTTGPEITIMYTGDGTDGAPGTWTVTVVDPESGVDWITVEIDGVLVGTIAGVYTVPNTLATHTIIVTAANADLDTGSSDQETSTLSDSVAIVDDDVTGPSILITYVGDMTEANPGYWTVTISDAESGIYSIAVEIDGVVVGTFEGDYVVPSLVGDYTITVTAINDDLDREADQETSVLSDTVTIVDVIPPVTLIELSGTMGLNNWYISDVTVTLTVDEEATMAYSINGGPWLSYTGPFVVGLEGDITISYNSTDTAGNLEVTKETSFRIDTTPPDLDYDTESIPGEGILVTIIASDSFSGLGDVEYSLDGDLWLPYEDPFLLSEEGLITVHFRATDLAGNSVAMTEEIEVIIEILTPPTELSYSGDDSGVYSDPVYLEALLLDGTNQLPIPGKTILFTLGTKNAYAVTNADGLASVIIIIDQEEGIYALAISFAGDDDYLASSNTSEFVIYREYASAIYSGITIVEVSEESITLMATVFDDTDGHWGDITHIYVTFVFYLPSNPCTPVHVTYPVRVQTTAVVGVGLVTLEIPNLPEGDYLVLVSLLPGHNRYYCSPDSDTVTFSVYEPERASAKGAGKIKSADGHNGYFVFNVRYNCKGSLKGFFFYIYRVDDWVYFVRSSEILSFVTDENNATFEANCTFSRYNFKMHTKVCSDEIYRARIDVFDSKNKHEKDVFQILLFDGIGLVELEAGFNPFGFLVRGHIIVNPGRRRH